MQYQLEHSPQHNNLLAKNCYHLAWQEKQDSRHLYLQPFGRPIREGLWTVSSLENARSENVMGNVKDCILFESETIIGKVLS